MAKLKQTRQYFVQIGLKTNGKIVKNEEYTLDQFSKFIIPGGVVDCRKPSFLTRLKWLFNPDAASAALTEQRLKTLESCRGNAQWRVRVEVDKDSFGKKKKR